MTGDCAIRIEAATFAAVEILAALHAEAFVHQEQAWDAAAFADLMAMPGTEAWLALRVDGDNDVSVGFMLARFAAGEGEILSTGVAPQARRQGIGQSLLLAVTETADRSDAALFLEVAVDNAPAICLYQASGFAEAGRRKDYYWRGSGERVDALVLRRDAVAPGALA